jgi:hypothetical protein
MSPINNGQQGTDASFYTIQVFKSAKMAVNYAAIQT